MVGIWVYSPLEIVQLHSADQFHRSKKQQYSEKATDMPQVPDKCYHINLHRRDGNQSKNVSVDIQ